MVQFVTSIQNKMPNKKTLQTMQNENAYSDFFLPLLNLAC